MFCHVKIEIPEQLDTNNVVSAREHSYDCILESLLSRLLRHLGSDNQTGYFTSTEVVLVVDKIK